MELASNRLKRRDLAGALASRRGTLAVALICALIAAAIIVFAINRYRNSVSAASAQATVLVASHPIQKGTSGAEVASQGLFSTTQVLQKQVTVGAFADAAALQGKVAVTNILPGQQLTTADFAAAGGIATQLSAGQRAIAVPVDQPHGLVGVLQSGDHVDVYGSYQGQNSGAAVVRLLAGNVPVLQGPTGTSSGVGGQQGSTVVLAAVPKLDAELAYTVDNGKIWLVLRPGNGTTTPTTAASISSIVQSLAINGGSSTGGHS